MAHILEQLSEKIIDIYGAEVYDDPELAGIITAYNHSVVANIHDICHMTLISVLIEKGIITEDEYNTAMQKLAETSYVPVIESIDRQHKQLMSIIHGKNE